MPTIAKTDPIIVIIGPSGCGKSTIVRKLQHQDLVTITPTWTDRPPRPDEEEVEHEFVSAAEFDRLADEGFLLGVVQPFGLPYRYGLPAIRAEAGHWPLVMFRAQFIPALQKFYSRLVIYQIEATYEFAEQALQKRSTDHGSRLADFDKEVAAGRQLASRCFVNKPGQLDTVTRQLEAAIRQDLSS